MTIFFILKNVVKHLKNSVSFHSHTLTGYIVSTFKQNKLLSRKLCRTITEL